MNLCCSTKHRTVCFMCETDSLCCFFHPSLPHNLYNVFIMLTMFALYESKRDSCKKVRCVWIFPFSKYLRRKLAADATDDVCFYVYELSYKKKNLIYLCKVGSAWLLVLPRQLSNFKLHSGVCVQDEGSQLSDRCIYRFFQIHVLKAWL